MKKALKLIGRLIINAGLVIIAYYLLKWLLLPAIITTAIVSFFRRKIGIGLGNIADYSLEVAVGIDQLGNVVCADLFNLILINKDGYKFGNPDETISSVLGKNYVKKTLSLLGRILDTILNFLDKNHSVKSIEEDEG